MASNSVFISYRRSMSAMLTLAIWQDLHMHGIDAFYDIESITIGQFDSIILNQIAARPYFMLVLTPGTLDRCHEPGDWLYREIEFAVEKRRHIIPVHTSDFSFDAFTLHLPTDLANAIRHWNAVEMPQRFFKYVMQEIRDNYLKPIDLPLVKLTTTEQAVVKERIARVAAEATVTDTQLSAQEYLVRGMMSGDARAQLRDYSEAIRLDPKYAEAYVNRAKVRQDSGDLDGALADLNEALRLEPANTLAYLSRSDLFLARSEFDAAIMDCSAVIRLQPGMVAGYLSRGNARKMKGDLDGAISDYTDAIRLNPKLDVAYNNRGVAKAEKGDHMGAIGDYNDAIMLNARFAFAYNNRGNARRSHGDMNGAIQDYSEAIRLDPKYTLAYKNRGKARELKGERAAAVDDYRQTLLLDPNDPDAARLREFVSRYG